MFSRARLLQLGYVLTLGAVTLVLALPTVSQAQFRKSMPPPPPRNQMRTGPNPLPTSIPDFSKLVWGTQNQNSGNVGQFGQGGQFGQFGQGGQFGQFGQGGQFGQFGQGGFGGQFGQGGFGGQFGQGGFGGQFGAQFGKPFGNNGGPGV